MLGYIIIAVLMDIAVSRGFTDDLEKELLKRRKVLAHDDEIGLVFTHLTLSNKYLIRYLNEDKEDIGFDLVFEFDTHEEANAYYVEHLRIKRG